MHFNFDSKDSYYVYIMHIDYTKYFVISSNLTLCAHMCALLNMMHRTFANNMLF